MPDPAKDIHSRMLISLIPRKVIARTIAKLAPALMPSTLGDARGLRVTACIIAPAMARLAPIEAAMNVRGSLAVITTTCSIEDSS
ncbi:hypothetical protein D3C73_1475400 [compost metagenome]